MDTVIKTLYEYIYELITTYILPASGDWKYWGDVVTITAIVITLGLFWAFICRPVWWFFKYGLWGGKKGTFLRKGKKDLED